MHPLSVPVVHLQSTHSNIIHTSNQSSSLSESCYTLNQNKQINNQKKKVFRRNSEVARNRCSTEFQFVHSSLERSSCLRSQVKQTLASSVCVFTETPTKTQGRNLWKGWATHHYRPHTFPYLALTPPLGPGRKWLIGLGLVFDLQLFCFSTLPFPLHNVREKILSVSYS